MCSFLLGCFIMANISTFMLCGAIEKIGDRNINAVQLISPQVLLCPPCIPGSFSFGLSAGIVNLDTSISHDFYFEIVDPNNDVIYKADKQKINCLTSKITIPIKYQGFMFCSDIRNLMLKMAGEYIFKVYVDEKEIDKRCFSVYSENILNGN